MMCNMNAKPAIRQLTTSNFDFSPESEAKVCNPVSLGSALESGQLLNYWESTGQITTRPFPAMRGALARSRPSSSIGRHHDRNPHLS